MAALVKVPRPDGGWRYVRPDAVDDICDPVEGQHLKGQSIVTLQSGKEIAVAGTPAFVLCLLGLDKENG